MPQLRRHLLHLLAVAVFACGAAAEARADTVFVVGNTTGSLATATVTCSFNAQTNTLTLTIVNTSPFDARITGFGFDIGPGNINGFTGNVTFQPMGVNFTFTDADLGNVNQFPGVELDFGFLTGANFSGGDPNEGLPPGIDPGDEATFVVSGAAFAGLTEEQICNAIFIRFQRVGADGELSDVGTPNPIPEPMTLILFGTGLSGVAAIARRRRRQAG